MTVDPIHQFQINNIVPIITIGKYQIDFTNSALFMLIIVVLVSALLIGATAPRAVVPGRLQSVAEMSYEFVANTVRSSAGTEGMKFFPFVFTLFMFVLFANMIGLIPYSFTVTSQLIITATLALLVFFIVVIYGFWRNGLRFLKLFVPSGVPVYILPAIVVIEVLSFISRPVSHSVRLFANMLAGHITLQVFAGFIIMLAGFGVVGWLGAALPLITRHHAHGARVPGRFPASLRLRHSHLHLSQRCDTPGPLTAPSRRSPARGEGREGLERSVPMDPTAAKYIGAGIACIGMGGAGVGVGIIFGNYLAAALRNPSAAQGQFGNLIFGFAITEALGIFSLLIALLLLFGL